MDSKFREEVFKMRCNVKHFYSFAKREHGLKRGYSWTKNKLMQAGLIKKTTKGGKHRKRK